MRKIMIATVVVVVSMLAANFTALALRPPPTITNCPKPVDGAGQLGAVRVTCATAAAVVHDAMYVYHHNAPKHVFDLSTKGELWHVNIDKYSTVRMKGVATGKHGHRVVFYIA
jgi:hypothetical protein